MTGASVLAYDPFSIPQPDRRKQLRQPHGVDHQQHTIHTARYLIRGSIEVRNHLVINGMSNYNSRSVLHFHGSLAGRIVLRNNIKYIKNKLNEKGLPFLL